MKLTVFLLLLSVISVFASKSYSQTTVLSLDMKNSTVKEVLRNIEKQSEFVFMYSEKLIDVNREVSVNVKNKKINEVLDELFAGTEVSYKVKDRFVLLTTPEVTGSDLMAQQQKSVYGKVTDLDGQPLPGVTVVIKGTTQGTVTNADGNYSFANLPVDAILQFSFVGMKTQEVIVGSQTTIDITLQEEMIGMEEVVVVGYGTQKKSDITGSVASVGKERLELVPNLNVAQAIQGAIPGVMMQTTTGGAVSEQTIMIRGRNSILADNSPLIVVDGITYTGALKDLNPNDIESIEVLKDASAAAIYGSRGANGVILITSKVGTKGKPRISYNGYYSVQDFVKFPDLMNGEEFYEMKMERAPELITQTEKDVYESGQYADWIDMALRNGKSTEHNLSVSGGFQDTKYYISGGVLKVKGLAVNDDYLRLTSRINLDTKINDWLTIGTRTQLTYDDLGGLAPEWDAEQGVFWMNPLLVPYDEDGNLTIYPWPEDHYFDNPLQDILAINEDESYQVFTNNYAIVEFPFVPGLQYRIETGLKVSFHDTNIYKGRNTTSGFTGGGRGSTGRYRDNTSVVENILNYNIEINKNNLQFTGVYSYESNKNRQQTTSMSSLPNDFLTWYAVTQAGVKDTRYSYNETTLLSQMLRLNYSYDSRYLATITGRRDGYSGFGAKTKWGFFPSVALGWNMSNENFFPWKEKINVLKWRISYGLNGNQAISAYQTMSRLGQSNYIEGKTTLAGYMPTSLGMDNLGWESSKTLNIGVDFGVADSRITGEINYYKTNTFDLLLNRTISPVHGFTSITQNIGKTQNNGLELSFNSRNITKRDFQWRTNGNLSWMKNKIVSLYGELNEEGVEIDDISNAWFIGQPIRVNYGYVWDGIWQLAETEEAAKFGTQPGYVRVKDVNKDGEITPDDRTIVGQRDPKFLWGLTNTWSYKNFSLLVFIHGVHGATKGNSTIFDDSNGGEMVRSNFTKKDFWTPENQDASHPINKWENNRQKGISPMALEKAGFVRIKDITLSYDLPIELLHRFGFEQIRLYATGRNQFTITGWTGLDPELAGQTSVPLQKELVFGLNLGF